MNHRAVSRTLLSLFVLLVWLATGASAGGHGGRQETRPGILLVAFGSSEASAQVSFENLERRTRAAHPEIPVRWAYTSHIIRHKLAGRGELLDSPEMALARMRDEGFTHVAVQSLHTIGGAEYHELQQVVGAFRSMGGFDCVLLGDPLLASQEDMERVVEAVLSTIPSSRRPNEAVLLMGHGTHHPSNAFYAALMFQLQLSDANLFVGTVEGFPGIDVIRDLLLRKGIRKVYLMPLMSVAGDHAKNDMAGDQDDSWTSVLTRAGLDCVPVLKGTAEYDVFADIWVDHIPDLSAQGSGEP